MTTTTTSASASLREFLASADMRTADPMEAVVLAEMAGHTHVQAREEGFDSLFDAVEQSKPAEPVRHRTNTKIPEIAIAALVRAFLRGLLFVAPLAPLFVLLPRAMSTSDYWLVTFAVIAAWGLGMGLSHVARTRAASSPGSLWREALKWNAGVLLAAAAVGVLAIVTGASIGMAALAWAALHVLYVLAANLLISTGGSRALAAVLAPGVIAAVVHWMSGGTINTTPTSAVFAVALISVLGAIVLSLVRVWRSSRGQAVSDTHDDATALSFIVYGSMLAGLVLWLPITAPGFTTGYLFLALIICLGFAEAAAQYIRSRGQRDLADSTTVAEFRTRMHKTLAIGVGAYALALVTVLAVMAAPLIIAGEDARSVILTSIAVLILGVIQLLALLGVSYHAKRRVTELLGLGIVGLLGTLLVDGMVADSIITLGFLVVAVVLATNLAETVERAARTPIAHY